MRARCAILLLSFVAAMLASPALAAEPKFPVLSGRVVDDANVLSASTQTELTDLLAAHEHATGEQVVVVTLASLQGYSIEDYGYQLGRHWGIGEKGKNTGAILIVAPNERKVRIEVGYGLEGKLTDAISRTIIESDIVPNFRRGDFNAGIVAGTKSILDVLGGNPVETGGVSNRVEPPHGLMLGAVLSPFLIPLIGITFLLYIVFTRPGRRGVYYSNSYGGFGGGSSFGVGSSGGGGGGFSGGGGSFGGGGASGSW